MNVRQLSGTTARFLYRDDGAAPRLNLSGSGSFHQSTYSGSAPAPYNIGSPSFVPHNTTPLWASSSWGSLPNGTPPQQPPQTGRPPSNSDIASDEEAPHYDRAQSPLVDDGPNENFKVAVRVRPPLPRETEGPQGYTNVIRISPDHKCITICEQIDTEDGRGAIYSSQSFSFDYVYMETARQKEVYERSAKSAVLSVLQGYNSTMIAYGQTGTGKTYTMEGFTNDEHRGIIPRATEEIFYYIQNCQRHTTKFLVRASYVEIYNENFCDLLKPQNKNLVVRQSKEKGVYVDGLSEWVVRSPQEIYGLMAQGSELRMTGSTKMSERSSRSHAIFIVICETMDVDVGGEEVRQCIKIGKLNIVDLAGSEKVRQSGVTGARLEETKSINKSLHELGNVIGALTDPSKREGHIPYRNSKLTRLLEDSLGGNCKTTMIACISPALDSYGESLSTLKFANRAKNIKNDAVINEDLDQGAMLRKYERELKRLRTLLQEKNHVDPQMISQLEDKNRRAEEDRVAALRALQERTGEYEEEKQSKEKLMEHIQQLETALMKGGYMVHQQDPAFRSAMQKVSEEYMTKLDELDKERQVIEEDKAHVERYKQLLLKQRDIMVALTARLNERDEVILNLQEELDAYDDNQSTMEAYAHQQKQKVDELSQQLEKARQTVAELEQSRGRPANSTQTPAPLTALSASDARVREVEARLESLRWQHSQFRSEMTERLEERNRQITQLQEERDRLVQNNRGGQPGPSQGVGAATDSDALRAQQREIERMRKLILTHSKDRKALRKILEQRIKVKVDTIGDLMRESFTAVRGMVGDRYQHMENEVQSLQTLLNAAIGAMEDRSEPE